MGIQIDISTNEFWSVTDYKNRYTKLRSFDIITSIIGITISTNYYDTMILYYKR